MIPLSSVSWGPVDALERDRRFSEKWVEPDSIKRCLHSSRWIISGEKGSGKSAIRRAITELYKDNYLCTPEVDYNELTFTPLYREVVELSKTTNISKTTILSHYWQYSMIVEMVRACAAQDPARFGRLLGSVPRGRQTVSLNDRLLALFQDAWNMIDVFTGVGDAEQRARRPANLVASSGLAANLLGRLARFPLDRDYLTLKKEFFSILDHHESRVVLLLDGFDRLRMDGGPSDSIGLMFASLIDAILSLHADRNLPELLEIKAFIPHDRYIALELRDSDKVDSMHAAIRWSRDSLEDFVQRRISVSTKLTASTFQAIWKQVFPETVTNARYNLSEDSFDYLLRHTMYRPRQLQHHLEYLGSHHEGQNIDPSMVPKSIAESSKNVARHFINEYKVDYPYLDKFVQSFDGKCNVMEFGILKDAMVSAIKKYNKGDKELIEDHMDRLYAMGFFGVLNFLEPGDPLGQRYCPPTRDSRRHYVDFFFKNAQPAISGALNDNSMIALHPVFIEYANLKPHGELIVG